MRAGRWLAGMIAAFALVGAASPPPTPAPPTPEGAAAGVLGELLPASALAPGVTHREFVTTEAAGQVRGDVVEVDLTVPGVRIDLLVPGVVAARRAIATLADETGAVAGINGDFFDIGRTSAPTGPAVRDGRALKAAVPQGRRFAPAVPGAEMDYVFAVGVDGVARVDRLPLVAEASGPYGTLPIVALNQHAVPEGGVGIFTADWGNDRAQTLCGTDSDRDGPCAEQRCEIAVIGGVVTGVGLPDRRALGPDEIVLTGRDQGAAALCTYRAGDPIDVEYELSPESGVAPRAAVGAQPILRDGQPTERLDDAVRAPRSAAGHSADGRRVFLVTVDGRQSDSVGATLAEMSALLAEMGAVAGVNLDGGGSSTLAYREDGAPGVTVVNDPSDPSPRRVGNGLGVYVG